MGSINTNTMKNTLTDKQRKKLLHTHQMPDHIWWWTRSIALADTITEQQYETAVQVAQCNTPQLQQRWIFQDQLLEKPQPEMLTVKKSSKIVKNGK